MRLSGKVALVTGSGRGIGAAIVKGFAREGAKCVINYRNSKEGARQTLEEIKASMGSVVEGVATAAAALEMARNLGVELPITDRIRRVLFEGLDPAQAMAELIGEV